MNDSLYKTTLTKHRIECAKRMTGNVLDIGGGLGIYLPYFNGDVTISDIDEKALERVDWPKKVVADAANLPFEDNTFDSIFLCGVAQYFDDFDTTLQEMKRVLTPNGKIVMIVGNSASPWDKIKALFGMRTWNKLEGAKSFYTPDILKKYGAIEAEIQFYRLKSCFETCQSLHTH